LQTDGHGKSGRLVQLTDLLLICLWCSLAIFWTFIIPVDSTIIQAFLGIPLTLFIPGYVTTAAIFPSARHLDTIERIVLSLCLSVAAVSLIAFALNFTPYGILVNTVFLALTAFIVLMVLAAAVRRIREPDLDHSNISHPSATPSVRAPSQQTSKIPRILLAATICILLFSLLVLLTMPRGEEQFSEFYILNADGKAADYPSEFYIFEPQTIILGIRNHEYHTTNYSIEAWMLNDSPVLGSTASYASGVLLDRLSLQIPHNETKELTYDWSAPSIDYNKIIFLLIKGNVSSVDTLNETRIQNSDEYLYLWVKVLPKPIRV
jgi:uncharacterized membrane protein